MGRGTHFDHRSDIDLMVEDFPAEASCWHMENLMTRIQFCSSCRAYFRTSSGI